MVGLLYMRSIYCTGVTKYYHMIYNVVSKISKFVAINCEFHMRAVPRTVAKVKYD